MDVSGSTRCNHGDVYFHRLVLASATKSRCADRDIPRVGADWLCDVDFQFTEPLDIVASFRSDFTLEWLHSFGIQIPFSGILLGIILNTVVLYVVVKSMRSYRVGARDAG